MSEKGPFDGIHKLISEFEKIAPSIEVFSSFDFDLASTLKKDMEKIGQSYPNLGFPLEDLEKLKVTLESMPKFEIPKIPTFDFPNIAIPTIDIDFERLKKITDYNSKFGWSLTNNMSLSVYFNDDLLGKTKNQLDEYFFEYYTHDNMAVFCATEDEILSNIEPNILAKDCLNCFKNEQYHVAIPALITIIEGELARILNTQDYGSKLIKRMKEETQNDHDVFSKIATYATYRYIRNQLFKSHDFNKPRREAINRNWILHGRDNPIEWTKYDALRLINVLASLQLVKDLNINEYQN